MLGVGCMVYAAGCMVYGVGCRVKPFVSLSRETPRPPHNIFLSLMPQTPNPLPQTPKPKLAPPCLLTLKLNCRLETFPVSLARNAAPAARHLLDAELLLEKLGNPAPPKSPQKVSFGTHITILLVTFKNVFQVLFNVLTVSIRHLLDSDLRSKKLH